MFIKYFKKLIFKLYKINDQYRKLILIIFDLFLIFICTKLTLYLNGGLYSNFYLIYIILSVPTYVLSGQYKGISKYTGTIIIYEVTIRNIILISFTLSISYFLNINIILLKDIFLLSILSSVLISSSRILIRDLLFSINNSNKNKKNIIIYGAGEAGALLQTSLKLEKIYNIKAFIDDNPNLWGRKIDGTLIISFKDIDKYTKNTDKIILAIPSIKLIDRKAIYKKVEKLSIPIVQIPSMKEILTGKLSINTLRPINIEDLLRRDCVKPYKYLLDKAIKNKIICVTGGAGSIGSELCKQILRIGPKKLILIDNSESSIYEIEKLIKESFCEPPVDFILGDVTDCQMLVEIFNYNSVEIVFHSAAYKHVPIVEKNPIQGLKNNYLSTKAVCEASKKTYVKKMVLISSDKAVRPTNIMGASKRLSELIIQDYAGKEFYFDNNNKTIYTMVRFGNVLNSSGSVIPLFKKQIKLGGPLTVTDKRIIRYFMTLPEAALLVIQSSSIAEGGEVFLLDMGSPINIFELAKQMIKISGFTLKNKHNKDGDIEIKITGLRPGEKLYEELIIDAKSEKTSHSLIFKAKEKSLESNQFKIKFATFEKAINERDIENITKSLSSLIPEWKPFNFKK